MSQLILWHGWGMHPAAWDSLAVQLASQYRIAPRVHALPGYAGSAAPATCTMDALTDVLLADVSEPITLCGWSLGALLALHAAQRQPRKIARLILIGATPSFVQRPNWPHGMTPQALAEFAAAVDTDAKTALKRFIALFNQNDVNARNIGRDLARALATDTLPSAATLAAGLALLRDTDLRAVLPGIQQPTLIIHGAQDPLMPLGAAESLGAGAAAGRGWQSLPTQRTRLSLSTRHAARH